MTSRRREYVRLPRPDARGAAGPRRFDLARRIVTSTAYVALAWARGGPGIAMRLRIARLGARLLVHDPDRTRAGWDLLLTPMDSFRYFEFEFAWAAAQSRAPMRYLDVSSPRLFPATLVAAHPSLSAYLINPDERDLAITRKLLGSLGLASRCTMAARSVESADLKSDHYDLVTAISVIEHIPEPSDASAIERLWRSVKGGGRMVLTVPCAASAFDEYLDLDEYGFQPRTEDGFWFAQRFYDEALLEERLFRTCGPPYRMEVFGEGVPGTFNANRSLKVAGRARMEREPHMMATEYRRFRTPSELPGLGVVGLEFRKP